MGGFTPVIDENTGQITGYRTTKGGADTVFPFNKASEPIYLGNGTSFNIGSLVPNVDYTKLTSDNFIVGVSALASSSYTGSSKSYSGSILDGFTLTKSYNASTGILSLSGTYARASAKGNDGGRYCTCTGYCTCFAYLIP